MANRINGVTPHPEEAKAIVDEVHRAQSLLAEAIGWAELAKQHLEHRSELRTHARDRIFRSQLACQGVLTCPSTGPQARAGAQGIIHGQNLLIQALASAEAVEDEVRKQMRESDDRLRRKGEES